jgi:hypothetical protein
MLASSYTETGIENFRRNKLLLTNKVLEVFRDVLENRVHIIIQLPLPSATTGKCLLMVYLILILY